jgi:transcriptional regulator of acetoin/glycerol metabolism
LLVETFMGLFNRQTGKTIRSISSEAMHCLMDYCWPGNVRELENALEHAYVTCQNSEIGLFDLPPELRKTELREAECPGKSQASPHAELPVSSGVSTREQLIATLENCGWSKAQAARRLGLNRATIWRKMKQWDIPLEPPTEDASVR